MRRHLRRLLLLLAAALAATGSAAAQESSFTFGVVASDSDEFKDEAALGAALTQLASSNLAFVVAQGIHRAGEPCDDAIARRRKSVFEKSPHGLIVSLGAADWAACPGDASVTGAIARLTRVREAFFNDEFSFGVTRLPLVPQSTEAKFRSFVENARWEIGSVMFATVNLPANNNHYVMAAGRNGEFEDRLVANREWLRRVFTQARLKRLDAVVLFSEANPLKRMADARRDGFAETRRHLLGLAHRFEGMVLVVHGQTAGNATGAGIKWRGNVGEVGLAKGLLQLRFNPAEKALFSVLPPVEHG